MDILILLFDLSCFVFGFEIGLATSELSDATFKVGLCDEKGLFKQIEIGL